MTVQYNFLNLPIKFTFTGNKVIDILYDGSGRKLRKTVTDNGVLQYKQDYASGIEYRSTSAVSLSLESIYHAEGRVFNANVGTTSADVLRYEYTIKDHLGNARLTFTDKNNNGVVDVTNTSTNEVLQENHYYPFGLNMSGPWMDDAAVRDNFYQYNGKELNTDFGLGLNDYGARWYDASVGRWWSVDLMAETYTSWSPYNYVIGNPINNIDPTGNSVDTVRVNGKNDESFHWNPGATYEGTDDFITQTVLALNYLTSNNIGDISFVNDQKQTVEGNIITDFADSGRGVFQIVAQAA